MAAEVVFIGDDFTGASDSLATYARTGWRSRLVLRPAEDPQAADLDAVGVPTDLRSLAPDAAKSEIARLWPAISAIHPSVIHYKVCSTFDSAPGVGSIGAVTCDLVSRFKPDVVAVIGGQPSLGRYCTFGTLFARGPDGAVHRIDRHPIMSRHPVTPMNEADLRLHLEAQGLQGLELIAFPDLHGGNAAEDAIRKGPVLFDLASAQDQVRIAEVLRTVGGRQLLIGASSVAEILVNGRSRTSIRPAIANPRSDAVFLFAGSRSATTRKQVEAAVSFRRIPLEPEALHSDGLIAETAALVEKDVPVLVHLLPDVDYGLSPDALANASSRFVTRVIDLADVGYLGLAGGDTSSRICAGLGFRALEFQENLGQGVGICTASHRDPRRNLMRLMLKGGQMGSASLFEDFLRQAKERSSERLLSER